MHPAEPLHLVPMPSEAARIIGAIPARYGSTRLAGKVLRPIAGRPMVEHVYRRAEAAGNLDVVVVLTDDARVADAVNQFGGKVEMTPETCRSGTDRIAFAAHNWNADAIVNIQGDEPLIEPSAIALVAQQLREQGDEMVTLAAPAEDQDASNPNVVKVVLSRDHRALYFSRSAIPYPRHEGEARLWRHIGIYGYRRDTLLRLAGLEPTPLEKCESLEQLRALENGIPIRVLSIAKGWPGVDTIEDLDEVERLIAESSSTET